MSTHWNFFCIDHPADDLDRGLNHGEDYLRQVWGLRNELAALKEADTEFHIELDHFMWSHGSFSAVYNFIARHKDCNVVLRNEYGDEEPIEGGECEGRIYVGLVKQVGSPRRCQRGVHSTGKHRFKVGNLLVEWSG